MNIAIFDTTLRDGEQSPGAALNTDEKLELTRELLRLGVDVIEAGFPASSEGDYDAVGRIASLVGDRCVVCALTRAVRDDIERAVQALEPAVYKRIHTGLGVSPTHLKKLNMTPDEAAKQARDAVAFARSLVDDVQFYAEDATRADRGVLAAVLEAAIDAGARTLTIPDTTGYSFPEEFADLIHFVKDEVVRGRNVAISIHCHNDLGLATANSLAGIAAGASQVECTVNGIGERAGNAATEEIVMALKQRPELFHATTRINTHELTRASRVVSQLTGIAVQPNKAIVGANAFAHASGIHQDGVLKDRLTYEIIDPAEVGARGTKIMLTARSGHHALRHRLEDLGYALPDDEFERMYAAFLDLADKKKEVYDEDLESLINEETRMQTGAFRLERLQVSCGSPGIPTATVELVTRNGERLIDSSHGNGPVDAVYNAINRILHVDNELTEFTVQSITRGMDAIGEVVIRIKSSSGLVYSGRGAHPDIVVACARAYTNALNRLILREGSSKRGEDET